MTIKAMKQALDALAYCEALNRDVEQQKAQAIESLRAAIEQAEKQEPVAWITEKISGPTKGYMTVTFNKDTGWKDARSIPLYERPPQREWVGLTDEEIDVLVMDSDGLPNSHLEFARAIEVKFKEKNA